MEIERVYYKHWRIPLYMMNKKPVVTFDAQHYQRGKTEWEPSCKGGITECYLVFSGGTIRAAAECSIKDNFNYRVGREIAYGRAMKEYNEIISTAC